MAQIPERNIGMDLLQGEYGGNNPIRMDEYYRKQNNSGLVNGTRTTSAGYAPASTRTAPFPSNELYNQLSGASSTVQNGDYRRETFVYRYPYDSWVDSRDQGTPININLTRYWKWGADIGGTGTAQYTESVSAYDVNRGADKNPDIVFRLNATSDRYTYYVPNAYIYSGNGSLQNSGQGGNQNPGGGNGTFPNYLRVPYTVNSVGRASGVTYYASQSNPLQVDFSIVRYGLVEIYEEYIAAGTVLVNQSVPTIGPISLKDFRYQEN